MHCIWRKLFAQAVMIVAFSVGWFCTCCFSSVFAFHSAYTIIADGLPVSAVSSCSFNTHMVRSRLCIFEQRFTFFFFTSQHKHQRGEDTDYTIHHHCQFSLERLIRSAMYSDQNIIEASRMTATHSKFRPRSLRAQRCAASLLTCQRTEAATTIQNNGRSCPDYSTLLAGTMAK